MQNHKEIDRSATMGRIVEFFDSIGFHVRVRETKNRIIVVYKERYAIPCFISDNEEIVFVTKMNGGEVLGRYNLFSPSITRKEFSDILEKSTLGALYRVRLTGTDLYLSGFNLVKHTTDPVDVDTKYPIFSKRNVNTYFREEWAEQVVTDFPDYDLEVA